ncbi:hypothetical protein OG350_00770 [Streptomyces achromogenes]|uniref:Uncharacterized protein n=1 Tax=Streptomyces achromogenes TaxID=67255 RepID=A0ABZ1KE26_STRAH
MSAADRVVASWVETTGCGTRYEDLTADGQVHVDYTPLLGEPWFEVRTTPGYKPVCGCPRLRKQWCDGCIGCIGCVVCGQCRAPHVRLPLSN